MMTPVPEGGLWFIDEKIKETEEMIGDDFLFTSHAEDNMCRHIYDAIGAPELKTSTTWTTFRRMVDYYENIARN